MDTFLDSVLSNILVIETKDRRECIRVNHITEGKNEIELLGPGTGPVYLGREMKFSRQTENIFTISGPGYVATATII